MTNETNGLSSAILSLVAAFEAERKAFETAYSIYERRVLQLESEIASLHRIIAMDADRMDRIEGRIDNVEGLRDWLDTRFEEEAAGISQRVQSLELSERIRAECDGPAIDKYEELEGRLDEIERAAERLESRVEDIENHDNDDAVREAVERVLEGASLSISI